MVDRISTYSVNANLLRENMRLQTRYAEAQFQVSTGLKTDRYEDLGGDSRRLLDLRAQSTRMKAQVENSQVALDRVNYMYSTVQKMTDLASSFLTDLSASMGGGNLSPAALQTFAQQGQNELVSLLNSSMEGRYLFAGSMTNTAPVDLTDPLYINPQVPVSVADTEYYQGDQATLSVQVADGLTVNYGINADNAAFEQFIRAFNLVINNAANPVAVQEAFALVRSSVDAMANILVDLSEDASTIDRQMDLNVSQREVLEEMISSVKDVDMAEAATRLQQIEVQLEASYSTTTRLLGLKLHDFI